LVRNQPKPKSVQRSPKSTTSMTVEVADDDIGMGVSLREPAINILTVLDLDDASMSVVFEEIFLPQENVMKLSSLAKADASLIGKTVEEITEFNDFLSASGRYLIVSKKTSKRVVTELKKMARKETYCVESVPQTHTQN